MWHAMVTYLGMGFSILNGIDFGIRIDTKERVNILDSIYTVSDANVLHF